MLLLRLTSRLLRAGARPAAPPASAPTAGLLVRRACALPGRAPPPPPAPAPPPTPTPRALVSLPGRGAAWPLQELLLPRAPPLDPRENRLEPAARPALQCPAAPPPAARLQCRNVLKIRRRKMNHHKYRKLVRRTRFLRRRVRDGRLKRKQAKFESDLRRIWLKAGLKEAPAGWQTPKIYLKGK